MNKFASDRIAHGAHVLWRWRVVVAIGLVVAMYGAQLWVLQLPEAKAAYSIANSARFNDDDSPSLSKTFGGAGTSRDITTASLWFKRANLTGGAFFELGSLGSDSSYGRIYINDSDQLVVAGYNFSWRITSQLFRDPSKWHHLVIAYDTSQATANDRVKVYLDGSQITAFGTTNNPSQNDDMPWGAAALIRIGAMPLADSGGYWDGYLSDIYVIDGQALTPTSFGEYDANGYWRPKSYTGTYGTNGFKLDFASGSDLGNDVSGNNNDFTANNLDATDQVVDTPTNTYAVFNPLDKQSAAVLSNGNTRFSGGSGVQSSGGRANIAFAGKVYYEMVNGTGNVNWFYGLLKETAPLGTWVNGVTGNVGLDIQGSNIYCDGTIAFTVAGFNTTGQPLRFAVDYDTGKVWIGNFSGWLNSSGTYTGDPAAGTNPTCTVTMAGSNWYPASLAYRNDTGSSIYAVLNAGQLKYASSTATANTYDSSAGGYFFWTPPSGFLALSTANLPTPAVVVPKNYIDAFAYTGFGTSTQIINKPVATRFNYTGSDQTFTVPSGVTSVRVKIWGAGGGSTAQTSPNADYGGAGAYVEGALSVSPGQTLKIVVGQGGVVNGSTMYGGGGASGDTSSGGTGSGGGYSGVFLSSVSQGNALAIAGGGGGAGNIDNNGRGGSMAGIYTGESYGGGFPGGGGTQSAGGAAGGTGSTAGSALQGGNGSSGGNNGGGGGGGYYGGGGGGSAGSNVGAGGGGSSYIGSMTNIRTATSTDGSAAPNSGDSYYPPGTTVGRGGGVGNVSSDGSSGHVVIQYSTENAAGFTPSLVWIKDRTATNVHGIFDAIRSVFPYLSSNSTAAEVATASTTLTAFLSNGFTLGANALFNTNTNNYISWNWKESATSGFDVVNYTGTGANRTISHSLGVAADFMIIKDRAGTNDWAVYHAANTSAPETDYLLLNAASATADDNTYWNDTLPTASVFSVGTNIDVNQIGENYTAYLFASSTGYSSFGSYTGNGSADGPFVFTGFKPKYILIKQSVGGSGEWFIYDTARDTYNPASTYLMAQSNAADATLTTLDVLSNGFKLRTTNTSFNGNGSTYVYAAFAEQPFQQSAQPYNLTVASSTRFNDDDGAYISKTYSGAGNQKTWTWSGWVKRGNLGGSNIGVFGASTGAATYTELMFDSSDRIYFEDYTGGTRARLITNEVFRDPAAWIHIVLAVDTTAGTAADRNRLYINGKQVTSFNTQTNYSQDVEGYVNGANIHALGSQSSNIGGFFFDGYLSDVYLVDGQQLTPSDFGEYDTSGYWRPKTYSGTYGTNGFHLPLTSATTPGDDTGTNNADWTANNLDATDNVKDSPTNNFATLDPLLHGATHATLSDGNLRYTAAGGGANFELARGNQVMTTKTYWEWTVPAAVIYFYSGITDISRAAVRNGNAAIGYDATNYPKTFAYLSNDGKVYYNSSTPLATYSTAAAGDTLMFAYDPATGEVWIGKNGTWFNSGDPAAGTGEVATMDTSINYTPAVTDASSQSGYINFGQSASPTSTATVLPYRSTAGGYFQYAPPTDFKALSTANLPTPTITQPNNYFNAVIYTGTGAAQNVLNSSTSPVTITGFQPSLVWIKDRTSANAHGLFDSLRSAFPYLSSNSTAAEVATASTTLTSFLSNGFLLGTSTVFNTSGNNYISWLWKEDTTAGMDIVSYLGNGSNRTISHSLGVTPDFMIIKDRAGTNDWAVYHRSNTSAPETDYLLLNSTAATADLDTYWNDTAPTASVFSLGTNADVNTSGNFYTAYLFASTTGMSSFGSYTGNGSADGPFVYTGFKPRFIMYKRTDTTASWMMIDTARDTYNAAGLQLKADATDAEGDGRPRMDILSNGFKQRDTDASFNASGGTYIYAAFAEQPFKYSAATAASSNSFVQALAFLLGMTF